MHTRPTSGLIAGIGGAVWAAAVAGIMLLAGPLIGLAEGQPLDPIVNVSQSSGNSRHPHMAVDAAGTFHVVWTDDSTGVFQIRYRRSFDRGQTFTAAAQLSNGLE